MNVKALSSPEELQRYVEFAHEVYSGNPAWVPPDPHHVIEILSGESAFAPQTEAQSFWAEEGGRVRATITAFVNSAYNEHWRERMGHIAFFEALPGEDEAAARLIGTACAWLRERGCEAVRMSFFPAWQLGYAIDAYDQVPTIFHAFNPPYYHSMIKNSGFITEAGVVQYQIEFTPELAARYREMAERAAGAGVTFRNFDFDRLEDESKKFAALHNETFSSHWGFPPLSDEIVMGLTVGLRDFLVPEFTVFAEVDTETAGFVYSLPDLNQAFHAMKGRNPEENTAEFQQRLGSIDHGVLLDIGVREKFRGRGINLALAARSYLAMIERGYKTGSYTLVLDENRPSRRTAEKLGARITRNYNVYRMDLI